MTGDDKLKSGCGAAFSVGVDVLYNKIIQEIIIKSFFFQKKRILLSVVKYKIRLIVYLKKGHHFKKGYY